MIDNESEYRRMFGVEQKLWWYVTLHRKILGQIESRFGGFHPDLNILDAACGTGGLLSALKEKGYYNCSGFDYSPHAVSFSRKRGLDVAHGDLKRADAFRPGETYDVICCQDALYFLSDAEIMATLDVFRRRLRKGGIVLINIHAFQVFAGTHDIAVGSTRRFTLGDFRKYAPESGLQIVHQTYWPFFLSLPILLVRTWQRIRMQKGDYKTVHPDSDVRYPGDFVNSILEGVMRLEEWLIPSAPFGSSLFMVLEAGNATSQSGDPR